jgi:16S rRNA (adenine1518-N6/adenine1519-N6)-dimethyltransferase
VVAVELDRESVSHLKTLKLEKLSIKHGDFLAYDIHSGRFRQGEQEGWSEAPKDARLKIVGNVPYQITGLILSHLLGEIAEPSPHLQQIDCIVLTVQKEVAQRMVAKPGSKHYARLSLLISYFCDAELLFEVPASSFFPAPKVDSAVVRLYPLAAPPVECKNHKFLRKVIKAGFAQRRKMLRNALTSLAIPQEQINDIFKELRFDPQVRAETLSLQQFALLTDALPAGKT